MEYALDMLIPIAMGLFLGLYLQNNYGVSPIWTVVLAILGMVAGLGILYKRFMLTNPGVSATKKKPGAGDAERTGKPSPEEYEPYRVVDNDEPDED